MTITAALAALTALAVTPAGASAGPARPVMRHAAARPGALPFGMSALDVHRMLAQRPLDQAADTIRGTAARTRAGRHGFVQLRVDADHGLLTVYWHGRVPDGMARLFAGLRTHLRLAIRPARYTAAELRRAVREATNGAHRGVTSAEPRVDGDGILVGMTRHRPARRTGPAVQRMLGTAVPAKIFAAHPARLFTCQDNTADTLGAPARCDDLAPGFWGGAVISVFADSYITTYCTTGFGVHFANGSTGMLTAGHCIHGDDSPAGTTWWNGQATTELGSSASTPFLASGTTGSDDSGVIKTPAGSGDQYYDGPSIFAGDTHNTKTVAGAASANPGDWICESGAIGGVLCNIQVQDTGMTQWFNDNSYKIINLATVPDSNPNQPQGGDSGGPVFSLAGTAGTVTAKGTVTGGSVDIFYFTPWQVISKDLGVSVNTG